MRVREVFILYMPITASYDFKVTDANGKVAFFPDEDTFVIKAQKEDYADNELTLSVEIGEMVSRDVIMSRFSFSGSRDGCDDFIPGVVLCDYNLVSCFDDSDCETGRCDTTGKCSNFNWTICDVNGIDRGSRCFYKYTGGGILKIVTNAILDNFLYVLVIVMILIGVLLWKLGKD